MYRKVLREFFLLQRGEQRAMIMMSVLFILLLGFRMLLAALPPSAGGDSEAFEREARHIMAEFQRLDSLKAVEDSLVNVRQTKYVRLGHRRSYAVRTPPETIALNCIDSAGLLPLPGVGPVFAGRIISYRSLLGGYVAKDQLLEVYGMDSLRYLPLIPLLSLDTSSVRKLKLNQASFRELLRHPYMEYEDVLALVQYRDRVGNISTLGEIEANSILSPSVFLKAKAYFEVSQSGN